MSIRQGNNTIAGGPWDFEKQITNCITQIPQDIKLELNNGTLTLKAGSKVYVPNGSGVFDTVTIASDVSATNTYTGTAFVFYNNNSIFLEDTSLISSGTTPPNNGTFYNTSDNTVKRYVSGAVSRINISFPIAIVTCAGAISSIDQVFNGFGYIGNTIYMLPGVKGLLANGFNEDGSLKNYTWTNRSVKLRTLTSSQKNHKYITTNLVASIIGTVYDQISSDTQPTVPTTSLWYIPKDNLNARVLSNGTAYIPYNETAIGKISLDSTGRVLSLTPKTAFHAVDYNDSSTISGWSMPSSRYIDLTLGASGTTYTAPANGWFYLNKIAGGTAYIHMYRDDYYYGVFNRTTISSDHLECLLPCRKGDVITVVYSATGTTNVFRFYYAEGENV